MDDVLDAASIRCGAHGDGPHPHRPRTSGKQPGSKVAPSATRALPALDCVAGSPNKLNIYRELFHLQAGVLVLGNIVHSPNAPNPAAPAGNYGGGGLGIDISKPPISIRLMARSDPANAPRALLTPVVPILVGCSVAYILSYIASIASGDAIPAI